FWANAVAIADVNGDGRPDVAVANCASRGSHGCWAGPSEPGGLFLGNGDGHFQPAMVFDSGGIGGFSIVVADVDGDGQPDLLVANACNSSTSCAQGTVGVLLGHGDGSFQPTARYASGGLNAFSGAVSDVNRDGDLDLIVANGSGMGSCSSGCVGVLLGNGDGTFRPGGTFGGGPP